MAEHYTWLNLLLVKACFIVDTYITNVVRIFAWRRYFFAKSTIMEIERATQARGDARLSSTLGGGRADPAPKPVVLRDAHPLTLRTQKALGLAKPGDGGALICAGAGLFPIGIMPGSEDRLLLLLDMILKECMARGARLATLPDRSAMDFGGELVWFSIDEPANRRRRRATTEEMSKTSRPSSTVEPIYDFIPSRKFTITLWPRVRGSQDVWRGVAASEGEKRLDAIVSALQQRGQGVEVDSRAGGERDEGAIEQADAQERLRRERDATAFGRLEGDAKNWRRARDLNLYLDALEASRGEIDPDWLTWARDQTKRLDPLTDPPLYKFRRD